MDATAFKAHIDVEVGDWVRFPGARYLDGQDLSQTLFPIDQIRITQDVWREMDGTPNGELKTSVRFLFAIGGQWYRREEFEPMAYRNGQPWPRRSHG